MPFINRMGMLCFNAMYYRIYINKAITNCEVTK